MKDAKTISDGASPSLPWDNFPATGENFATYKLGKVIGKGGFGTVYQVQPDSEIEWYEAVKILHRSSGIDKERFLKEISRLKEIRLPGIARIHTTSEENGYLYYSMDYVDGESFDLWALSATNQTEIYRAFIELCNTVQNLHDQDFIHLDIKPQNVMVNSDAQVKLLDFGISVKKGTSATLSADGLGSGTYEFASPEQIQGNDPAPHMDVYALACLLYSILTCAHPKIPRSPVSGEFISDHNLSREEIIKVSLSSEVEDIRSYNFEISPEIASVLNKALGSLEERFKTVAEFRTHLIRSGCLLPAFRIVFHGELEQTAPFLPVLDAMKLEFAEKIQIVAYTKSHSEIGDFEVHDSDDLQLAETELRKALFKKLSIPDDAAWKVSPYKSLQSYTEEDAHLFFGRDKEIAFLSSYIENLDPSSALVTVLAPSGAGKSSFLKAGIIPVFKQSTGWNCVLTRPNNQLISKLNSFSEQYINDKQGKLLVIIDQFEEALQSLEFFSEMAALLTKALSTKNIRIVLSLRNDFYQECISFLESAALAQNLYNLPKPGESSINRMIRMPALKAHLKFENDPKSGKSLVEILKNEAMQNPESLAALSFTLDEIFRRSSKGIMSYAVYKSLGGMHGAMARRAETLLRELNLQNTAHTFHKVFQRLIKVDENHTPRRLYTNLEDLTDDPEANQLVDAFIEARLFTVESDGKSQQKIISVSHEALIQEIHGAGWERVITWLSEQKNNLLIHKRVRIAANEWNDNAKQHKFLLSNSDQVKEILQLQKRQWDFDSLENEFIRRSRGVVIRRYIYGAIAIASILIITTFFFIEANLVQNLTEEKRQITKAVLEKEDKLEELNILQEKKTEQIAVMNDYSQLSRIDSLQQSNSLPTPTALSLLSEVREQSRNWMWGQLLYKTIPEHLVLFGHKEEILSVEFSHDPESKYLLTASWDDTAILWDSYTGVPLVTFNYSGDNYQASDLEDARFSYDGFIALACNDGKVYVWNVNDAIRGAAKPKVIKMNHTNIRRIFFSTDNKYMICCGSEGRFTIWDWQNKFFEKPLAEGIHSEDQNKRVYSAELSPDGKTIISVGWDKQIKKWNWDGQTLTEPKIIGVHKEEVWWGEFSPNGNLYVSAGRDKEVMLWDVKANKLIRKFGSKEHKGDIRCATFSPDSKSIITTSRDKYIRLWDVSDGSLIKQEKTHDNMVYCADFSSDGKRYASVSADRVLNVYKVEDDSQKSNILFHSDPVLDFDYLDGQLVSVSVDGEIRFWDLHKGSMLNHFEHNLNSSIPVKKVMFIDEKTLITADVRGGIKLWNYSGHSWSGSVIFEEESKRLNSLILSKDKNILAASFKNGETLLWSIKDSKIIKRLKLDEFENQDPSITFMNENELLCGLEKGSLHSLKWNSGEITKLPIEHDRKVFYVGKLESKNKDLYVSCSRDSRILLFDQEFKVHNELSHGVRGDASFADVSIDGDFLVSCSSRDNNMFVWDLANNLELLPLSGHDEPLTKIKVISNSMILSSSRDGTIRLWRSVSWPDLRKALPKESPQDSLQTLIEAVKIYQLQKN